MNEHWKRLQGCGDGSRYESFTGRVPVWRRRHGDATDLAAESASACERSSIVGVPDSLCVCQRSMRVSGVSIWSGGLYARGARQEDRKRIQAASAVVVSTLCEVEARSSERISARGGSNAWTDCQSLFDFEPQRWRLYETRQASHRRSKPSKGQQTQGRKVPGVESPGKPDSDGDVARGARTSREARFLELLTISVVKLHKTRSPSKAAVVAA